MFHSGSKPTSHYAFCMSAREKEREKACSGYRTCHCWHLVVGIKVQARSAAGYCFHHRVFVMCSYDISLGPIRDGAWKQVSNAKSISVSNLKHLLTSGFDQRAEDDIILSQVFKQIPEYIKGTAFCSSLCYILQINKEGLKRLKIPFKLVSVLAQLR